MADLNENRPGYKKTKVGWIPEEWDSVKIEDTAKLCSGQHLSKEEYSESPHTNDLPYFTGPTDIVESIDYVTKWASPNQKVAIKGELLITVKGSGAGRVDIMKLESAILGRQLMALSAKKGSNLFIFYWLIKKGKRLAVLSFGNMIPGLSRRDILTFKIPLPPLPEQRAIARIVSTWDAAIDKLGQLISKKQALKKGLMQQLLSGRVRFPEFVPPGGIRYKETKVGVVPEDWEVVKAGEIFERVSKKGQSGELLAVTQEEGVIPRSHLERRVVMPSGSTEGYKLVEPGNFIISLRSFQGGLEYSAYRGLVSPAYNIITYNPNSVSSTFFRYYFKSYCFIERLSSAVIGIRDGKQISYPDFKRQLIPLPGYKEQKAIGAFLKKADQEIKNLENQRVNLETQKKGLMQQLLTGAVRVKETNSHERE